MKKSICTLHHLGVMMNDKGRKRIRTSTSGFGTTGRHCHDASRFYRSRLYEGITGGENIDLTEAQVPESCLNRIFCKSSEQMDELPDSCVHLMITSPPYNVSKDYDQDLNLDEYLAFLARVWQETYRVLVPGGRACINVANLGRKPYIPLHSFIITGMAEAGFLMRGEIIWDKASSASTSTAWGSWLSASNPVLRDVHEYILVFSKKSFRRESCSRESTIKKESFLEWTKSVWKFPAVSARQVGHPAPFPEELPYRLIQMYSFKDDLVLDPFSGSGTTCMAAYKNARSYVGYEISHDYVDLARKRIEESRVEGI